MKFGILGEAKIAREYVVPAILAAGHEVTCWKKKSWSSAITKYL